MVHDGAKPLGLRFSSWRAAPRRFDPPRPIVVRNLEPAYAETVVVLVNRHALVSPRPASAYRRAPPIHRVPTATVNAGGEPVAPPRPRQIGRARSTFPSPCAVLPDVVPASGKVRRCRSRGLFWSGLNLRLWLRAAAGDPSNRCHGLPLPGRHAGARCPCRGKGGVGRSEPARARRAQALPSDGPSRRSSSRSELTRQGS